MSIELVKEVLYNCPEELDGTARLLLVVLAEMSQNKDRRQDDGKLIPARTCFPSQETLMKRTGIKTSAGLRSVYAKLAKFGLDPRVVTGVDRNGRDVYAFNGHKTNFRVPELSEGETPVAPSEDEGETSLAPSPDKGVTTVSERSNHGFRKAQPQLPPNRKEPEGTLPPSLHGGGLSHTRATKQTGEEILILQNLAARGLGRDEAQAVLEYAQQDSETVVPRKRLDLPAYLSECRRAVKASQARVYEAGTKCEDHPTETGTNCRSCKADVKCGQRDPRLIGKHQPACSDCFEPLVKSREGATNCDTCAVAVPA